MRTLAIGGTHYEMGAQHARQVQDLLPAIEYAMACREAELAALDYDYAPILHAAVDRLGDGSVPTWEMLRAIADGLALSWTRVQRYALSSYLLDMRFSAGAPLSHASHRAPHATALEGCSDFAAAAPTTKEGTPLLAKNRDYLLEHAHMQTVTLSTPAHGYRYLHLGSAGSPGVFSAGINEQGVAIADTHIVSRDLGPGLPRYALMMDVLERCATTAEALDYLRRVRHMGGGSLILADSAGVLAVCESGYRHTASVVSAGGWVVTTNHFVMPKLCDQRVNTEPPGIRGHSQARRRTMERLLARAEGQVDVAWAQRLLGRHQGGLGALCRHDHPEIGSATIAGLILLPATRQMVIGSGYPCTADWQTIGFPTGDGCV